MITSFNFAWSFHVSEEWLETKLVVPTVETYSNTKVAPTIEIDSNINSSIVVPYITSLVLLAELLEPISNATLPISTDAMKFLVANFVQNLNHFDQHVVKLVNDSEEMNSNFSCSLETYSKEQGRLIIEVDQTAKDLVQAKNEFNVNEQEIKDTKAHIELVKDNIKNKERTRDNLWSKYHDYVNCVTRRKRFTQDFWRWLFKPLCTYINSDRMDDIQYDIDLCHKQQKVEEAKLKEIQRKHLELESTAIQLSEKHKQVQQKEFQLETDIGDLKSKIKEIATICEKLRRLLHSTNSLASRNKVILKEFLYDMVDMNNVIGPLEDVGKVLYEYDEGIDVSKFDHIAKEIEQYANDIKVKLPQFPSMVIDEELKAYK